jgi:hypothetical protein
VVPGDQQSATSGVGYSRTMTTPEECAHDDVLEDSSSSAEDWDSGMFASPSPRILDQDGVCKTCGARVIRHGSPEAWTEWMVAPERPEGIDR